MWGTQSFFSIFSPFIVLAVISSIGLHSLQVSHDHPGGGAHYEQQPHGGSNTDALPVLGEYLHMAEKKLFLAIAAATLLSVLLATILYGRWSDLLVYTARLYRRFLKQEPLPVVCADYIVRCFAKGILHPKLH